MVVNIVGVLVVLISVCTCEATSKFKVVANSANIADGWRLASVSEVQQSLEAVKLSLNEKGAWIIAKLKDGSVKGSGYRYTISKTDQHGYNTEYGDKLIVNKRGLRCAGIDNGCCTSANPCGLGDGDCDEDDQCVGSLVCGNSNCPWGDKDDCCIKKKEDNKKALVNFQRKFQTNIASVIGSIGKVKTSISNQIGSVQSSLSSRIAKLENNHKNVASPKLTYTGRGSPAKRDQMVYKGPVSLAQCLVWCHGKGTNWNAAMYFEGGKQCQCYRNASGFKKNKGYAYYRSISLDHKNVASKPTYIGHGAPAKRDEMVENSPVSLAQCLVWCRGKGTSWNGAMYFEAGKQCQCYRNASGFKKNDGYAYYLNKM